MLKNLVKNIKIYNNVTLVTLSGIDVNVQPLSGIFTAIADRGINLDMISQTPNKGETINVSFSVPDGHFAELLEIINGIKQKYHSVSPDIIAGNIIVSFYNPDMVDTPGVAAKILSEFESGEIDINIITTSDVSVSCLCPRRSELAVMRLIEGSGIEYTVM